MRAFFVFTMITKARPWRHIYHDIEIPKPKTTTSRFQDQKATASSSCGILTLMPLDISGGIRVRIPQELDVVAFWPWNLDVVVF